MYVAGGPRIVNQIGNMFGLAVYFGSTAIPIFLSMRSRAASRSLSIIVIGGVFSVAALLTGSRFVLLLVSGSDGSLADPGPLLSLLYLAGMGLSLLLSFAVVTYVNQLALFDLERAKEDTSRARDAAESAARTRKQALKKAQQSSKAKSLFLAAMSHELRTPLHGILGMVRHVLESPRSEEESACLQRVVSSGEHLLTIINDILDFSKLESGQVRLAAEPVNLPALLEETHKTLNYSAALKRVL